jgi:hypothetical protein
MIVYKVVTQAHASTMIDRLPYAYTRYYSDHPVNAYGNTLLLCFETLQQALDFAGDYPLRRWEVWEAEADEVEPIYSLLMADCLHWRRVIDFWEHKRYQHTPYSSEMGSPPKGTLGAKWLKLIRQV